MTQTTHSNRHNDSFMMFMTVPVGKMKIEKQELITYHLTCWKPKDKINIGDIIEQYSDYRLPNRLFVLDIVENRDVEGSYPNKSDYKKSFYKLLVRELLKSDHEEDTIEEDLGQEETEAEEPEGI